jgi:hypothetical protein
MALQASGRIKLSEIATQFGGSSPHKLSEYYRGGSQVDDTTINANIAASGKQKIQNYYSTGNPRLTKLQDFMVANADRGNVFPNAISTDSTELGSSTRLVVMFAGEQDTNSHFNPTLSVDGKTTVTMGTAGCRRANDGQRAIVFGVNLGNESSVTLNLNLNTSANIRGDCPVQLWQVDNVSNFTSGSNRNVITRGPLGANPNFTVSDPCFTPGATFCAMHGQASGSSGTVLGSIPQLDSQSNGSSNTNDGAVGVDLLTTTQAITYQIYPNSVAACVAANIKF